ncbi:MAG: hypothetical protein A3E37_00035 [Candidatus Andersenbacteria bacterium RIFCSPHIGHO2_12_FULL_46_9]|nr:MAG: Lipoprotein [Parcubacteria group bacterium GW2011_GWA2_45_14]OGY35458.1 MAG: hypothetical protein A3B76_01640 [Candidatus Andersenbacteria bacterium RIFCSPHIGHO2_02_FULL_46_16]OGY38379.1 MAG: hypothetical protein A3E37_00035 [Candidatus Andersenbacteria bacterium RIFCSPHIGHO2_12_FULL_46_9]OGY41906.1 MAG: hypothetical protein A3G57_00195 [Candidatus Andersenbacteria bacterium RIFCSPLOWO2_12_FULL_45_8]HBE90625.1 hypothetical protein [Candidatus Andersenbacteria bacterium]
METVNKIFKAKNELIVLAVLVPLVILLGVMIIKWPQLQTASISEEIVSTPDQTGQGVVVADTTTASIYPTPVRETVLLIIENGPKKTVVQVVAEGAVSVKDVMQAAAAENKITMEAKDYGESMGILIESINSVANDNGQKRYWYLYVNGQLSPVGASQAQVKAGDEVNWKYEEEKDE